jgi:integrase
MCAARRARRCEWVASVPVRSTPDFLPVYSYAAASTARSMANAAGVRPIRLHDARHSCGTAMHLRGVPLAVIAKWLGHADASITARIYAHSQDDALKAASVTLGQIVTAER